MLRQTLAKHLLRRLGSRRRALSKSYSTDVIGPKKGDRVVVAMSGGVDSSLTAQILAEQDYDLSGIYMRNWDTRDESGTDIGCEWERDWEDVQHVCRKLGLPCEIVDLSREYWTRVFEPSLAMWEGGETPNPDVLCNSEIKFGALFDRLVTAKNMDWLATGHYGNIEWDLQSPNPRPKLVRPADKLKDQTYFLSGVKESSLRKTLFPLRHLKKDEVKELARKYNLLPTVARAESKGICFIGKKRQFTDWLSTYIPQNPGPIINVATNDRVGTHQGLWRFTIGQKAKGTEIQHERPYVAKKDISSNTLFVAPEKLYRTGIKSSCSGLVTRDFKWIWGDAIPPEVERSVNGFRARVQIRYRSKDVPCVVRSPLRIRKKEGELCIDFDEPQTSVTPGQIAAIYDGEWCLGSGIISQIIE